MSSVKFTRQTVAGRPVDWFTPWRFAIFLGLLIAATFPQVLTGLETFAVRDYGFFAYPLASFQQQCYRNAELPLWDPYHNCGVPFLAQWNTMPLYPPAVFYLLLPLPWSLGLFCLLHLWFAGLGMYFLARRWTDDSFAGAFAGVAFAFNGLTLNLLMWPSHLATLAWMPWVVFAVESAWSGTGRRIILAAMAGAVQMLAGGPEIILFTWTVLLALWLRQFVRGETPRLAMLWSFPLVVALVAALTAIQLLPFRELLLLSQRGSGYADTRWSMPGWGWVNFLVPMAFGRTWTEGVFFQNDQYWTSSYYLGMATLWLAALAVLCVRERRVWLLAGLAVVALAFALGENTPVYPGLRKLIPQLGFMTYPIKYVVLVAFLAPLLAAFGLIRAPQLPRQVISIGAVLFILLGSILVWAAWFPFKTDDVRATLMNGLSRAAFLVITGVLLLVLTRKLDSGLRRLAPVLLMAVAWLDVFTHEPTQNPTVPPEVYQPNLARAALNMKPQPAFGESRAMVSPWAAREFLRFAANDPKDNFLAKRLGYCANVNLLDGVPKVDGFFSLTPREIDDVLSLYYTSTNADFPPLEDFLGVSQITAPGELFKWQARPTFLPFITAGQKPVYLDDPGVLSVLTQSNFNAAKTVCLPPEAKRFVAATNTAAVRIISSRFRPQQVEVEVESPAPTIVVFAQTYYPAWQATVDGQPAPLLRANHAFQAVPVKAGRHGVRLAYSDHTFLMGAAISLAGWFGCLLSLRWLRNRPQAYGGHGWEPDSPV
ncbi:MAG TPA: YfhO family protein [Candidatus Acidoferrum sp.]|nr:YfhO family protein [Candidatus Acidoferrum sp.]